LISDGVHEGSIIIQLGALLLQICGCELLHVLLLQVRLLWIVYRGHAEQHVGHVEVAGVYHGLQSLQTPVL